MRKRIILGNLAVGLFSLLVILVLRGAGVADATAVIVGLCVLVVGASVHAIRVLNAWLDEVGRVEEALLRASLGESGIRVGEVAPPLDGLAFRLDALLDRAESATTSSET